MMGISLNIRRTLRRLNQNRPQPINAVPFNIFETKMKISALG